MKKLTLLFLFVSTIINLQSQITVNVSAAGTLSGKGIVATTTSLTVTGTLDATDFTYMNKTLAALTTVDLSGVTIVEYTGTGGPTGGASAVTYPKNELPQKAFYNKTLLTSVVLPTSITSIGSNAFYGCKKITSLTIPVSVISINDGAFNRCTGLASLQIQSTVMTSIGSQAFYGCPFTSLTLPTSVTSISQAAFGSCSKLTTITLPSGITDIAANTFQSCAALESITIPTGVASVGASAFASCTTLSSILIPDAVTTIGSSAFAGCTALKTLNLGTINAVGADLSIESKAFDGCTALSSVTINDRTNIPVVASDAFNNVTLSACTLNIPTASAGLYRDDEVWKTFSINVPTAFETIGKNMIKIVPSSTGVVIEGLALGQSISVYSALGKCIINKLVTSGKESVRLTKGTVYVLKSQDQIIKFIY